MHQFITDQLEKEDEVIVVRSKDFKYMVEYQLLPTLRLPNLPKRIH